MYLKTLLIGCAVLATHISFAQISDYEEQQMKKESGKYFESGANYDWPYTTFIKDPDIKHYAPGWDNSFMKKVIDGIKKKINDNPADLWAVYNFIYDNGKNGGIDFKDADLNDLERAGRCKNAAFIYLIGLKPVSGSPANQVEQFSTHNNISDLNEMQGFRQRAMTDLLDMNIKVKNWDIDEIGTRSKALIMYLQAYDYLCTAHWKFDHHQSLDYIADPMYFHQRYVDEFYLGKIRNRLQFFAKQLMERADNAVGAFDRHNNHSLMAAGALGLASIVLNGCGFNNIQKDWHPAHWAAASNTIINRVMFSNGRSPFDQKMSERNAEYGYAEGPHYFAYSFENLMPFFRAYHNFVYNNNFTKTYHYNLKATHVVNYLHDADYIRLLTWYSRIIHPDGTAPSYDNSLGDEKLPCFMAIPGDPNLLRDIPFYQEDNLTLAADFLSAMIIPNKTPAISHHYINQASGDIVLRTPFSTLLQKAHYLRLGTEYGTPTNGGGHEHSDAGSFSLFSGKWPLAIDPPYPGYDGCGYVNAAKHHNLITLNDKAPGMTSNPFATPLLQAKNGLVSKEIISINLHYFTLGNALRTAEICYPNGKMDPEVYFIIRDNVNVEDVSSQVKFNLNGNGNLSEVTCGAFDNNAQVRWTHPCTISSLLFNGSTLFAWNLHASIITGGGGTYNLRTGTSKQSNEETTHGSSFSVSDHYITFTAKDPGSSTGDYPFGQHTRLEATKTVAPGNSVKFITVLYPYKCGLLPPVMVRDEQSNSAYIRIENIPPNKITVTEGLSIQRRPWGEEVNNPLGFAGINPILKFNADGYSLAVGDDSCYFKDNLTITTFRYAGIYTGRFMVYDGDTIIGADTLITAGLQLTGKHKYGGFVQKLGSYPNSYVSFRLDDCGSGQSMIAESADGTPLSCSYVDSTKTIRILFTDSVTHFSIRVQNECISNGFFPSATLDTTFDFNSGLTETLANDLKIIQSEGCLKVTNGSKVNICKSIVLINEDSLLLDGIWNDGDEDYAYRTDYNPNTGLPNSSSPFGKHAAQRLYSQKSMIVVNDSSGLILDSNSYTKLGANSTILVRKGGTLLIKDSATLEIGSEGSPGHGEVIIEDGGYLCVEMGARVRFYANPNDTADKNVFYVSLHPSKGAHAGVNTSGANGKFASPGGAYWNNNCVPACDIEILNTFNSVYNNNYGWANIRKPKAKLILADTICAGDSVRAHGISTLHETKYHFQICQYNPLTQICSGSTTYLPGSVPFTGVWDSIRITEKNLSKDFNFQSSFHYKVTFIVNNECDQPDTVIKSVYIMPQPNATFTLADSACPGYNVLSINGSSSSSVSNHTWFARQIKNLGDIAVNDENNSVHETDTSFTGFVSSNFGFPGFRFNGGNNYVITLHAQNMCGTDEHIDTIKVPLSARIIASATTLYTSGSVTLKGRGTGYTSFKWKGPLSTDTNTVDTVITKTITSNVVWRFTVSGNGCHDTDSVTLKINSLANAGVDDTICKHDSVRLGVSTGSLPPSYTYNWEPTDKLSSANAQQPWAKPDTTTTFTLRIKNGAGVEVESDQVTIWVDSLASPELIAIEDTIPFRYCFINLTNPSLPTNSYSWNFGDGSSNSDSVNPCHIFPNFARDTFFIVCLTVTNTCGDSLTCDTLYIDSTGVTNDDSLPDALPFVGIGYLKKKNTDESKLIRSIPNPTNSVTIIEYEIRSSAYKAEIMVSNSLGVTMFSQPLPKNSTSVAFDFGVLPKGIYYYTLIVDGIRVGVQKLSVY